MDIRDTIVVGSDVDNDLMYAEFDTGNNHISIVTDDERYWVYLNGDKDKIEYSKFIELLEYAKKRIEPSKQI